MKKLILLYLLTLVTTLSYCQALGPKISSTESEYDFGDIIEGDIVSHDFTILNTGDDVLLINRVKASCGCTAAAPSKKELEPGESTGVKVTFNSSRRKGNQKKHVYVFSNDPKKPQLRLSFKANILPKGNFSKLVLSETLHNFGKIKSGEEYILNVNIMNKGSLLLDITKIHSSCDCIELNASSQKIKPGQKTSLELKFDSSGMNGKITRSVTIFSNDPVSPVQTITILAEINE
ncbi:DUF1573 domain-containing protein [Bacteroidota bacterium]